MPGAPRHATSLKLDTDLHDRLRRLALSRRRTPHWLMREAIAEYVGREEARDALRAEALAAWAEYRSDGLHATGAEVDAWLTSLEAGEDAPPPPCHP